MSILETRGLVKRFGGITATDEVSLSVEEGEIRSIIGPNGAGKTTLFNLITGHLQPDDGTIHLGTTDITAEPAHRRVHHGLARSFQITNVFEELSVLDSISAALYSHRDDVGFLEPRDRHDDVAAEAREIGMDVGLGDQLDAEADELSHGERRRLEIGIILALDPTVILFDEPTAGMSDEDTDEIMELVQEVSEGRTVLLVEHDMRIVMDVSDTITVLHQGAILTEGPPDQIRANPEVQEVYLNG